jgi:hypothetical protein
MIMDLVNEGVDIAIDIFSNDRKLIPFIVIDNSLEWELYPEKSSGPYIFKSAIPKMNENNYQLDINSKKILGICRKYAKKNMDKKLIIVYDAYEIIDNDELDVHEKWDVIRIDIPGKKDYYYQRYKFKYGKFKSIGPIVKMTYNKK